MNLIRRAFILVAAMAGVLSGSATTAKAQAYPARPVSLLVPYTAGSGVDYVARILAGELAKKLGQPVIVQNQPGGGGTAGSQVVAKSPVDGYTLLITSPVPVTPASGLPYDPAKAFVLVARVTQPPDKSPISIFAPAGTPPAVIAYLAAAINASLASPNVLAQLAGAGVHVATAVPLAGNTPSPPRSRVPTHAGGGNLENSQSDEANGTAGKAAADALFQELIGRMMAAIASGNTADLSSTLSQFFNQSAMGNGSGTPDTRAADIINRITAAIASQNVAEMNSAIAELMSQSAAANASPVPPAKTAPTTASPTKVAAKTDVAPSWQTCGQPCLVGDGFQQFCKGPPIAPTAANMCKSECVMSSGVIYHDTRLPAGSYLPGDYPCKASCNVWNGCGGEAKASSTPAVQRVREPDPRTPSSLPPNTIFPNPDARMPSRR